MQKNKYCALQFSNDPFRKNCIFMKTLCKEEEKSNISVIFLRMFFRNRSFSSFFFSCTVVQNMHFHALTFTDEHVNLQNFQAHLWRIILFGKYFCFLLNTINNKLPFSKAVQSLSKKRCTAVQRLLHHLKSKMKKKNTYRSHARCSFLLQKFLTIFCW